MLVVIELAPELIAARGVGEGTPIRAGVHLPPFVAPPAGAEPSPCPIAAEITPPVEASPARRPPRRHRRARPPAHTRRLVRMAPLTAVAALLGTAVVAGSHDNPSTQPAVADEAPSFAPRTAEPSVKLDTPRFVPIDQAAAAPGPLPGHGRTSPQRPARRLPSTAEGPAALGLDLSGLPLRVTAADVPVLARDAYVRAAANADAAKPSCGLTWQQLAAVGYVTSEHGSRGGRHLTAAGEAPTPLFAPLLDGHAGIEYADSDHGALDGSSRFDRGVGPFAIVPFVWRTWGADGNGDGVRDPQQIDDAALTAADFLCVATPTVRTGAGFEAALHTYDSDLGFAQTVADVARTYAGLPARTVRPVPKTEHRTRARPQGATTAVSGGFGTSP